MDLPAIRLALLEVLRCVQALGGHDWTELADDACPIGALTGFDSYTGLEATVLLEQKLGCTLKDTAFVDSTGSRALTLAQIVERLASVLASEGAAL